AHGQGGHYQAKRGLHVISDAFLRAPNNPESIPLAMVKAPITYTALRIGADSTPTLQFSSNRSTPGRRLNTYKPAAVVPASRRHNRVHTASTTPTPTAPTTTASQPAPR